MRERTSTPKRVAVGVRLDPELRRAIERVARDCRWTFSSTVENLLREAMQARRRAA